MQYHVLIAYFYDFVLFSLPQAIFSLRSIHLFWPFLTWQVQLVNHAFLEWSSTAWEVPILPCFLNSYTCHRSFCHRNHHKFSQIFLFSYAFSFYECDSYKLNLYKISYLDQLLPLLPFLCKISTYFARWILLWWLLCWFFFCSSRNFYDIILRFW